MRYPQEIDRLIKKGLFDESLKKKKQKKEFKKSLKRAVFSLLILIIFFLVIQLIPSSSIEIYSEKKSAGGETELTETNQPVKKINIFKSILSLDLGLGSLKDESEINILALGKPGQGYPGGELTDTIILIHLRPDQEKAFLISLPRDLLIKTPQGTLTKINSLYNLVGIEGLKNKVEEVTGLMVNHYAIVDLAVVKEIIKLVGGLNVYVPQDINDPFFPGPNYTYQSFILPAGWRYLDSELALKYIRTRYTSPNGDFDRMARQQQVIRLLKQKVLALNPLWDFPTYLKIFNTLNDHIETDLSLLEIKSFYQAAKQMSADKINSLVIDKKETNLLTGGLIILGSQEASVVYPKAGQQNYSEVRNFIQKTINNE